MNQLELNSPTHKVYSIYYMLYTVNCTYCTLYSMYNIQCTKYTNPTYNARRTPYLPIATLYTTPYHTEIRNTKYAVKRILYI